MELSDLKYLLFSGIFRSGLAEMGGTPPPLNGKNPLSSFWQVPLLKQLRTRLKPRPDAKGESSHFPWHTNTYFIIIYITIITRFAILIMTTSLIWGVRNGFDHLYVAVASPTPQVNIELNNHHIYHQSSQSSHLLSSITFIINHHIHHYHHAIQSKSWLIDYCQKSSFTQYLQSNEPKATKADDVNGRS